MENNKIHHFHFHGYGCAVSKSSSSVLVNVLEGKSVEEAKLICSQFLRLLKNDLNPGEVLADEDFRSFAVVQEIPARFECAALPWLEMEKYLASL